MSQQLELPFSRVRMEDLEIVESDHLPLSIARGENLYLLRFLFRPIEESAWDMIQDGRKVFVLRLNNANGGRRDWLYATLKG